MRIVCREPSVRRAAGPGFILLGLITLLLLPATARGQSGEGPGIAPSSPPGVSEVRRLNPGEDPGQPGARQTPSQDLRQAADNLRNSRLKLASRAVPEVRQNVPVKPASPGWLPSPWPLPPASVFSLQTNFRKYLETWPTPGAAATGDWPEYIPEDRDNQD
jgi:hypothetical protein